MTKNKKLLNKTLSILFLAISLTLIAAPSSLKNTNAQVNPLNPLAPLGSIKAPAATETPSTPLPTPVESDEKPANATSETLPQKPANYVSDLADVLTNEQEALLNAQIAAIEKATTAEIAILTISTLDGQEFGDIDRFTYKVFNTWGIGKDDVDNGILLVTVINDRAFRIETGNGVEGVLTDYEAKLVTESNLVPNFRNQNYYQGFTDTVTDLKLFLEEDPSIKSKYEKIASKSDNTPAYSFFWSFGLAVIFSIILESIFKKDKSRKSAKRISGAGLFLGGVALLALGFIATLGITFAITGILLFIFSSKSSGGGSGGLPFLFMGGGGSGGFGGSSGGFGGGFGGFGGGGSSGGGFSGGW